MNLIHSSRIPPGFPKLQPLPAIVNVTILLLLLIRISN